MSIALFCIFQPFTSIGTSPSLVSIATNHGLYSRCQLMIFEIGRENSLFKLSEDNDTLCFGAKLVEELKTNNPKAIHVELRANYINWCLGQVEFRSSRR